MKILFLFTFFVLIIGQTSANELKEWLARVMVRNQIQFLQIGLKRPNMNPLCIQSMEHLAVVAKEAEKCVLELLNFETNTICGIAKAHYQKCSEPLINTTVSCVDEVYKDVPSFLVNTVDNLITYVCKSKWKHFFELMNPCFWRKGDESLKTCEKLVNDKMDKMGKWAHNDENQSLTVSEICGFFDSVNDCFYNHLRGGCKNTVTLEAFGGLYEALSKECKNSKSPLTNDL